MENNIFALYSASPMLPLVMPMTSAATPLFQQRPRPTVQAERKYGSAAGT